MKQKTYFKLFTLSNGVQVLYERLNNIDEDGESISTIAYNNDGTRMQSKAGFEDDSKKTDEYFKKVNIDLAKKWYDNMVEIISGK